MEKTKFRQNLQTEDLIAFNCYLVDRKSKSSIFPRLLGLFIFILGCIDISKEGASIPMCLLTMAIGVFGMLGLVPLSSLMQKRTIRKKLTEANQIVPMDVTVYEEGIRFELPLPDAEEEQPVEEETQEENQELSDNELRELYREADEDEHTLLTESLSLPNMTVAEIKSKLENGDMLDFDEEVMTFSDEDGFRSSDRIVFYQVDEKTYAAERLWVDDEGEDIECDNPDEEFESLEELLYALDGVYVEITDLDKYIGSELVEALADAKDTQLKDKAVVDKQPEDTEEAQTEEEQLDEPVVAKLEGEKQFNAPRHSEENPTNAFTIPWGGMSNVEETNEYLFVNVAGYQTMIIRKDACDNIEEVISYIKENLKDKRRYTYNIKKEQ